MKYMIASDIHGSSFYCEQLMKRWVEEAPDKLILLGDLLYHGPRNALPDLYDTEKVLSMLNGIADKILCVRGNCDSEVDQVVLNFPLMADYAVVSAGGKDIFVTHGHVFNESHLPPLNFGDILLHGHTHIPECAEYPAEAGHPPYVYMNPGSVSIPKDGPVHSFVVYEDGVFTFKDVETGAVIDRKTLK